MKIKAENGGYVIYFNKAMQEVSASVGISQNSVIKINYENKRGWNVDEPF